MNQQVAPASRVAVIALRICSVLLAAIGTALAIPGAKLLWIGGSAYYVIAGLICLIAAILLWRRDRRGAWLYLLFLIGTAVWGFCEVGADGWALLPRLAGPFVFGLLIFTPWNRRALKMAVARREGLYWLGAAALLVVAGAVSYGTLTANRTKGSGAIATVSPSPNTGDWRHFGNDAGGSRYSELDQITPENVSRLKLAWSFRAGMPPSGARGGLESVPLKVGGLVYLCNGTNDIIALDADTGAQRWRFQARSNMTGVFARTCRGVSYYDVPAAQGFCSKRVYTATVDARLLAVDALSGKICPGFGVNGSVNLLDGMGEVWSGYYLVTSPPQVVRGKLVVGGWVTDGQYVGEPSGVIRAFDAVTGKFAWAFDIGRPNEHGQPAPGQHYTRGTPNSWAPMSADEELGLVYVPTGNATPDYFGGHRTALDDKYSSAVVALDAETGSPRWSFQTTHHDVWDYDLASQPTLVDLPGVKGLLQPTKRGEIFFLDRRTGKPIAQVTETPVPHDGVPGERLSPTQPFSTGLPSFAGPKLSEAAMWGITPFDQLWCRIAFREARYDGPATPIGYDRPSVIYPGYLGGVDWGGVSVDQARGIMIVNSSRVANYNRLLTRSEANKMGLEPLRVGSKGEVGGPVAQKGTPYGANIKPFLSPLGVPCQQPPYGMLSAVDLKTHKLLWTQRFGTGHDSGPLGIQSHVPVTMGVPNLGGSVTTRSGLFFIGASQDNYLRAYDTKSGRELWRVRLPAGGQANPSTYYSTSSGRQFLVISAGGHGGLATTPGDWVMAYALPRSGK